MQMYTGMMSSSSSTTSRKESKMRRNNMKKMLEIEIPEHYLQQAEEAGVGEGEVEGSIGVDTLQNTLIEGMIIPQLNLLLHYVQLKDELRRTTDENVKLKKKYGDNNSSIMSEKNVREYGDMMEVNEKTVRDNIEKSILLLKDRGDSKESREGENMEQDDKKRVNISSGISSINKVKDNNEKEVNEAIKNNDDDVNNSNINNLDGQNKEINEKEEVQSKQNKNEINNDQLNCDDEKTKHYGDNNKETKVQTDGDKGEMRSQSSQEQNYNKKERKIKNNKNDNKDNDNNMAWDYGDNDEMLVLPTPDIHAKLNNRCASPNDRCIHEIFKPNDLISETKYGTLHDVTSAFRSHTSRFTDTERDDANIIKMVDEMRDIREKSTDRQLHPSVIWDIGELKKRVLSLDDKTKQLENVVRQQQTFVDYFRNDQHLKRLTVLGVSEEFPVVLDDVEYKTDWAKINALFNYLDLDFRPERFCRIDGKEGQTVRPILVEFAKYSERARAKDRLRSLQEGTVLKEIIVQSTTDRWDNLF